MAAALAAVFVWVWHGDEAKQSSAPVPEVRSAAFWGTRLIDLGQAEQPMSQWLGKVVVVNFWSSCCIPCQKEIPHFIAMQQALGGQGLQFVGIAIEPAAKAGQYATKVGINYPILQGEANVTQLFQDAGNRAMGMPYTVVFDRRGNAIASFIGEVSRERLEPLVTALL